MSNETKFTPGPWVVNEQFAATELLDGHYCAITAGSGVYGSGCYEHDGFEITGYIGMANAHLIASAPELYEALSDVMAQLSGQEKSCGHDFNCVCPTEAAAAALAKARGEL